MALHGRGRAVLCFPRVDRDDCSWFQGYVFLADARNEQLGILAEEIPVDDCVRCPDGGYREFRLTLMRFDRNQEAELVVAKTGGDLCRLRCDELQFDATVLLSDAKAVDAIRAYFPALVARADGDEALLSECLVCFGDIELTDVAFESTTPAA